MPWPAQANWLICERLSGWLLNCRTLRRLANASSRLTDPVRFGSVSWIIICGVRDLLRPRQSVAKQAKTIARIVKRFISLSSKFSFSSRSLLSVYLYYTLNCGFPRLNFLFGALLRIFFRVILIFQDQLTKILTKFLTILGVFSLSVVRSEAIARWFVVRRQKYR